MSIRAAFQKAFQTYAGRPGAAMKYLIVELCFWMICFSPLLFICDSSVRFLASLAVPLWILVMMPVRMNAASALQEGLESGNIFSMRLADSSRWGAKLLRGLQRGLFLILWSMPLTAALYYAYRLYVGTDNMDIFTLLQSVQEFGGGDVKTGIRYAIYILLALILILLVGIAFHSGARHAWSLGDIRLINRHHGKLVLGWICSLVTMLPLITAVIYTILRYMPALNDPNGLLAGSVNLPRTRTTIAVLGAGALLTLPLMPLKSLIIAAMVHQLKPEDAPEEAAEGAPDTLVAEHGTAETDEQA